FCRKLTELERKAGRLPEDHEYTLPTEAQWEYAARGGNKSSGYTFSGGNILDYVGWHDGNSNGSTCPVEQLKPNELGFYDMSGNVWEWCLDWYGDYTAGDAVDPVGPVSGSNRVRRGGSWGDDARYCRSALRFNGGPSFSSSYLGFRLALVPVQ
ncbi:MAG: formylglycine-generating enzyme family protein, partial [Lentisphaeria bacterium]|nr:formylglycine-generating enzyme family protein [Lentisphaeria bacterium]